MTLSDSDYHRFIILCNSRTDKRFTIIDNGGLNIKFKGNTYSCLAQFIPEFKKNFEGKKELTELTDLDFLKYLLNKNGANTIEYKKIQYKESGTMKKKGFCVAQTLAFCEKIIRTFEKMPKESTKPLFRNTLENLIDSFTQKKNAISVASNITKLSEKGGNPLSFATRLTPQELAIVQKSQSITFSKKTKLHVEQSPSISPK